MNKLSEDHNLEEGYSTYLVDSPWLGKDLELKFKHKSDDLLLKQDGKLIRVSTVECLQALDRQPNSPVSVATRKVSSQLEAKVQGDYVYISRAGQSVHMSGNRIHLRNLLVRHLNENEWRLLEDLEEDNELIPLGDPII